MSATSTKLVHSDTEKGSCGHAGFCAPKHDGQCDHVDGLGTHQGYEYRCLLTPHGKSRHFHDRRPEARDWFKRDTGRAPVIAAEQKALRARLAEIEAESADIRKSLVRVPTKSAVKSPAKEF